MLPSLLITPVVFSLVLFNQNSYISTGSYTYILLSSLFIPIVQQLFSKRQDPVHYLGVIYTGYILVIIPFAMLCQIANLEYPGSDINGLVPYTPIIVLVIFIFLWVSDSFAYVGGKLTGRTKLAPGISPGKTIEGLVSGLIMTNVSAFILSPYCYPFLSMNELIILANLCVISGLVGDLLISRFKRSLGIKDSGNSLPGHGGFLDRFDSLLIAAPAAYFYLRTILMFN